MCLGIPGEVMELVDQQGLRFAKVRFGAIVRDVCLEYVAGAAPGDYVLVHVGFAIARIDPSEAARTFRLLEELGQAGELAAGSGEDEAARVAS